MMKNEKKNRIKTRQRVELSVQGILCGSRLTLKFSGVK